MKKYFAEMIGTMVLVLMGCGSAAIACGYPDLGIGFAGVSLAFGLSVMVMVYAIGPISGCHINPAITFAMWMNPDPNKGFVQWLGDDVFNVGYTVGESEKTVDDKSTKAKSSNGTKTEPNTTRPTGGKVTGGANNGAKKPKMKKG